MYLLKVPITIFSIFRNIFFQAMSSDTSPKLPSAEDKGLTLADTQGMFLLLGAGFILAGTSLLSEWMGGFTKKCRIRKEPSVTSREELITSTSGNESIIHFDGNSSIGSQDSLNGDIINVTEENIMVHDNLETDRWESRSSSVDLDREVNVIFERDRVMREIAKSVEISEEDRSSTVSKGAFGSHLKH